MKKIKFETNLKCEGCVETLSAHLEKLDFVKDWEVDLASDKKILTVQGHTIDKNAIQEKVAAAGFSAKEKKSFLGF